LGARGCRRGQSRSANPAPEQLPSPKQGLCNKLSGLFAAVVDHSPSVTPRASGTAILSPTTVSSPCGKRLVMEQIRLNSTSATVLLESPWQRPESQSPPGILLIDFGFARFAGNATSTYGSWVGTPGFLTPVCLSIMHQQTRVTSAKKVLLLPRKQRCFQRRRRHLQLRPGPLLPHGTRRARSPMTEWRTTQLLGSPRPTVPNFENSSPRCSRATAIKTPSADEISQRLRYMGYGGGRRGPERDELDLDEMIRGMGGVRVMPRTGVKKGKGEIFWTCEDLWG
jgi:hypothetical protein